MAFGVYALVFPKGETYIGSTARNFRRRFCGHLQGLRKGIHHNSYLQRLFDKYGEPDFKILEECDDPEKVILREQSWIDQFQGVLVNLGPAFPCPTFGRKRHNSQVTRQKISEVLKGHIVSKETRLKISVANKGRHHTEEARRKITEALFKRPHCPHSEERRRKNSESHRGIYPSEETRRKIADANRRRKYQPFSAEHRKKLSASHKGKPTGPPSLETRQKISDALKKVWTKRKEKQ